VVRVKATIQCVTESECRCTHTRNRECDGWSKPVPGWIIVRESGNRKQEKEMYKKVKSIWIASVAILVACVSQADLIYTTVYSNNFNTYTTGNLGGQGSWNNSSGAAAQVGQGPGGGNTSQTATKGTNTTASTAYKNVTLGLTNYTSGTFQMDIYREASATGRYLAGLSNTGNATNAFSFGLNGTAFYFSQGVAGGTSMNLYSSSGVQFTTAGGAWLRLKADISFAGAAATITNVTIQNLTTSGPALTAYFDSGATQKTLALASDESLWNRAWVRTGISTDTNKMYVDNLEFVAAIPEPATIGMLGLGALVTLLLRRKMML
jgi:hypothetical protein